LSYEDRCAIKTNLERGQSIRGVAIGLNRSPNTISKEIRRNSVRGRYDPKKANTKAHRRRKDAKYQGMKIAKNDELKEYVDKHLFDDLTPEAISGRIKKQDKHIPYVSGDSIRRYIESVHGRKVKWHQMKKKRQRPRRSKRTKVTQLKDRKFIDKRPKHIALRRYVGHVEADFVESGRSGKGRLLTLADLKLRVTCIERIIKVTIKNVHKAFVKIKKRYPELKSITTDNDLLFKHHVQLEKLLSVPIYFCHPYSSWEKGSIENANKYIRKDIPKGSDISKYSPQFFKKLEAKLNRRPMKVLNYKTPTEMLAEHRKRKKRSRIS
jgi:transposase, IS30 family